MSKYHEYQWVSFQNGYGRICDYMDQQYEIAVPTLSQPDYITLYEHELTALEVPEFKVGEILIYTGFDLSEIPKGSVVEIVKKVDSIYPYEIRCGYINNAATPFELKRINY